MAIKGMYEDYSDTLWHSNDALYKELMARGIYYRHTYVTEQWNSFLRVFQLRKLGSE